MHIKDPLPQLIDVSVAAACGERESPLVLPLLKYCFGDLAMSPREIESVLVRVLEIVRAMQAFRGADAATYDVAWEWSRPDPRNNFRPRWQPPPDEPPIPPRQPDQ